MIYGWLISGPGSTWITYKETAIGPGYELTRNFKLASVITDPQEGLRQCAKKWPQVKNSFKLWTLTAEIVE